jgi:hypothetical protein
MKVCVYYESRKGELKTRPIYECRCDERLVEVVCLLWMSGGWEFVSIPVSHEVLPSDVTILISEILEVTFSKTPSFCTTNHVFSVCTHSWVHTDSYKLTKKSTNTSMDTTLTEKPKTRKVSVLTQKIEVVLPVYTNWRFNSSWLFTSSSCSLPCDTIRHSLSSLNLSGVVSKDFLNYTILSGSEGTFPVET